MKITRYAVVRYVPDPLRGEFINLGVVVATDDSSFWAGRFISDYRPVVRFRRGDIGLVKDIIRDLEEVANNQLHFFSEPLTIDRLQSLARSWRGVVQFSPIRSSVADNPEQLLDELFEDYVGREMSPQQGRTKTSVIRDARLALSAAISRQTLYHRPHVEPRYAIGGAKDLHVVDLALQNGHTLSAIECFSFEIASSQELDNQISATAWAFDDIRASSEHDIALFASLIPPKPGEVRGDYQRILRLCGKLGAQVIQANELNAWADGHVSELLETGRLR